MFKNYLSITLNNLLKDKLFSSINIAGLAIGLTACLLIGLYVRNETTYDRQWSHADRLYRVITTRTTDQSNVTNARNPLPLVPALRRDFAGDIEAAVRMQPLTREIRVGTTVIQTRVMEVDSATVAEIFDFEVLAGQLNKSTLEEPGGIALSADMAERLFGRLDVVGETLSLRIAENDVRDMRVGAVYRLPKGNTILREGLLQLPAMMAMDVASRPERWSSLSAFSYVLLAPHVSGAQLNARMREFADRNVDISGFNQVAPGARPSDVIGFTVQKLSESYLNSSFDSYGARGNKLTVLAFSMIAFLVLANGCINFIILNMAKAIQRAREVAIRKTVGASRGQLVFRYLGETLLIVVLAMLLSLALLELGLPLFETIIGKTLDMSVSIPAVLLSVLALVALVSLAGGFYPAFVLSRFRPASVLKSDKSTSKSGSRGLNNVLVIFQFAVTIALLVSTFVIYAQVSYSVNRSPGFNTDKLLFLDGIYRLDAARQNLLKQRIAALPGVTTASLSGHRPLRDTGNSYMSWIYSHEGKGESSPLPTISVDQDFFRSYQIPVVAGRDFADGRDQPSPLYEKAFQGSVSQSSVIINASALRNLGFISAEEAVGKRITTTTSFNSATHVFTIVGVAGDTQFLSPREKPRPEVYVVSRAQGALIDSLAIRYQGQPGQLIPRLEEVWRSVAGDSPFSALFMDQLLAGEFAAERSQANLLVSFALLAITIACLGLFGSATFNVQRRTKEIGTRKVFGAQVHQIVTLFLWQFTKPVMLANVIAWPLAMWVMVNWLRQFAYRIDTWILLPLCVLASLLALSIAWVTVGSTAAKAANQKPVLALRYE